MDKRLAYPIFLGLLLGAMVGFGIGAVSGNPIRGMEVGSMAGLLIGWFIAGNLLEKRN